jgi:hypothetical protein
LVNAKGCSVVVNNDILTWQEVTADIVPEGITIAIPLRGHTTVTKHESTSGYELDHKVELIHPRQNR